MPCFGCALPDWQPGLLPSSSDVGHCISIRDGLGASDGLSGVWSSMNASTSSM
jgi:hypothetical protein